MKSSKARLLEHPFNITKSIQNFNISQLFETLETLRKESFFLKWENALFEDFLARHDMFHLLATNSNMSQAGQQHTSRNYLALKSNKESPRSEAEASNITRRSSGTKIARNRSHHYTHKNADDTLQYSVESTKPLEPKINFITKIEMAESFHQTLNERMSCIESETKAQLRQLRAQLIETGLRKAELNRITNVFKRFVSDNSSKWPKRRPSAEKFIKLLEDCLRHGTLLVGQMRLRNSSQMRQLQRNQRILDKRTELNRTLMPIDFELLQIEKSKNLHQMEESTSKLDFLKRSSHNATMRLKKHKILQEKTSALGKNLILVEKMLIERISKHEALLPLAEMEVDSCHRKVMDLQEEIRNYVVPSTIDYVDKKCDLILLEKEKKWLIRQIYICKIKLQNLKRKLNKIAPQQEQAI